MCDKTHELLNTFEKYANPDLSNLKDKEAKTHKSLIYLQKELHLKKMRGMKPSEPIEKLYKLEATRRQVMQILQENSEEKDIIQSKFSFKPEINPNSERMVERFESDVVDRVYNWHDQKQERLKKLSEGLKRTEDDELSQKTEKYRFINSNLQVESKVRLFVESMDYRKSKLVGKQIYHSNTFAVKREQEESIAVGNRGSHGHLDVRGSKDAQCVQYQSEPVLRFEEGALGNEEMAEKLINEGVDRNGGSFKKKNVLVNKKGNGEELVGGGRVNKDLVKNLLREV